MGRGGGEIVMYVLCVVCGCLYVAKKVEVVSTNSCFTREEKEKRKGEGRGEKMGLGFELGFGLEIYEE